MIAGFVEARGMLAFTLMSLAWCGVQPAAAQERFPSKQVEMIVPWGPGGGADVLGRLVARWLEGELKVAVPVINMPGATGSIGVNRMVANGAEAYSIAVLTGDTLALAAPAEPQVRMGDIAALGVMIRQPSGIFARVDGPYKTWSDVIAAAKAKPGSISVGITGPGSPDEATVAHLGQKGVPLISVGYTRPGERYTAVLGGHVDLLYEQAGDVKGHLDGKALRPLIFFATQRLPAPFADVPVSAELGYEILLPQMRAIIARSSADPKRLALLAATLDRFAQTPEFAAYLRDQYALADSYIPQRDAQRFLENELIAIRRFVGVK
jgi:tripartite-type tricarboxylate transporter receptor subunit TctC